MEILDFFENLRRLFLTLHVFSVVLGMGAALVSDYLFSQFVSDFKINKTEHSTFKHLSLLVWFAFYAIVLSGIGVFLSDATKYMASDKFLAKMTIVFIVIINGYLMRRLLEPVLHKLNFSEDFKIHKITLRKKAFILGAVSASSWLSAFLLGMLKNIPYNYSQIMMAYLAVIVFAILTSQIAEHLISQKAKKYALHRQRR